MLLGNFSLILYLKMETDLVSGTLYKQKTKGDGEF
jgi:hypothetical protein